MPRIGPKKVTRRDDRDLQRNAEKFKLPTYGKSALDVLKSTNKPIMLGNKGERRALRAALSAEGISMERWICENECFYYVPVDRYLTTQYTTPSDLNHLVDKDPDPSLQMYIRSSEDCKDNVSDRLNSIDLTVPSAPARPRQNRGKMSRQQAKARHSDSLGSRADPENCRVKDCDLHTPDSSAIVPTSRTDSGPSIPTGTVRIYSAGNVLSADSAGRLTWCDSSSESVGMNWTLNLNQNGKYNLRSTYGMYLSHCLLWGFVADRASASTWEEFDLSLVCDTKLTNVGEVECHMKSWRGSYLGQGHVNKVSIVNSVDANIGSYIKIVSV